MDTLRRFREVAVIVVLGVLGIRLLLVAAAALTPEVVGVESGVDAAYVVSSQLGEVALFVLLAALVAACHARPVTPHARQLAWTALLMTGAALVLVLVLALLGYASFPSPLRRIELASRLLGLVLPAAAVVALGLLVARPGARSPALTGGPEDRDARAVSTALPAALVPPAPDPQLEPTWTPDTAAGAAWSSAGDAASGRPASGWGAPDPAAGWQPGFQRPALPGGLPTGQQDQQASGPGPGGRSGPGGERGPDPSPPAPEPEAPHPWSTPRP